MSFYSKSNKEVHELYKELKKKLVGTAIGSQDCDEAFLLSILKWYKELEYQLVILPEDGYFCCGYKKGDIREGDYEFYDNCVEDKNLVVSLLKLALADDYNIKEEYLKK